MIGVHHEIANRQACGFRQNIRRLAHAFALADQTVAKDILFGDDHEVGCLKPVFQSQYGKCRMARR